MNRSTVTNQVNKSQTQWSKKYAACINCGTTEIKVAGKGWCKSCYSSSPQSRLRHRLYSKEHREQIIKKSKEYQKTEAYRVSLAKYRSSRKYMLQYFKIHPGSRKEMPNG